jgi:transcriptional regulator with XRE-family HTH domain
VKLGDVLKKERGNKELSLEDTARQLGLPEEEYQQIEAGESPAEEWGPRLAYIAIVLETPTSRLLADSGRSADCKPGQAAEQIKKHRERRELKPEEVVQKIVDLKETHVDFNQEHYDQVEAGTSPIEKYGPLLLHFAELIEQPVFNLFYPCGLPFQELDDYP